MIPDGLRTTSDDKRVAAVRLFLGVMFVTAGAMKLLVPMLAEAWSGQLLAAGLPFHTLTRWTVPFVEMLVGALLVAGAATRPAAAVVIGIMTVAFYVHLVVDDRSLFPLQPSQPIIPVIVALLAALLLWRGGGAGSADLRATRNDH